MIAFVTNEKRITSAGLGPLIVSYEACLLCYGNEDVVVAYLKHLTQCLYVQESEEMELG